MNTYETTLAVGDVIQIESHPDKYFRVEAMEAGQIKSLSRPYKDAGCRMPWGSRSANRQHDWTRSALKRLNSRKAVTIAR